MIDWQSCTKWGTWGGLIEHAQKHGVTVQELPSYTFSDHEAPALLYLHRTDGEHVCQYPIPLDCTPDRKIGPLRYMQICSRMRIPEPKWPMVL